MNKLLGILPYIYLFDDPIQLGPVRFVSAPKFKEDNSVSLKPDDELSITDLIQCFPASFGISTNRGNVRAFTYFLLDDKDGDIKERLDEARKATTKKSYYLVTVYVITSRYAGIK